MNFAIVTTAQNFTVYSEGPLNSLDYLVLRVPSSNTCPAVKTVQFECSSHDQGWVSDPGAGEWSWGDLVVRKDGIEVCREKFVFTNAMGKDEFQLHSKLFGESSSLVKSLTAGCDLVLCLNAQFPGWSISANSGRLTITY